MTAAHKYLHEIIDYGGEPCTRAEPILHMQSIGMDQPCIDRWLQGNELPSISASGMSASPPASSSPNSPAAPSGKAHTT